MKAVSVAALLCSFCIGSNCHAEKPESGRESNETSELTEEVSPFDAWFTRQEQASSLEKWEDDIQALEKLDRAAESGPKRNDSLLLLGSSSIRRWEDAAKSLAPWPVIRRGYGGARYSDLVLFAERLIHPHQFQAVVIFVGNDISGDSKRDRAPQQVEPMVRYVVEVARKHQPKAAIFLVEVTPTPKRFKVWPKLRGLNAMLREVALTEPQTYFVPTADHFLDRENQPRGELFVEDRLHLNPEGYKKWSALILGALEEFAR